MLREIHRRVELREMAHAERTPRRNARELEMQPLRVRERAFGPDEEMRRVAVRLSEMVEVVAGHLAQQLREARLDLRAFALIERFQLGDECLIRARPLRPVDRAEAPAIAGDGDGVDGEHVVHHVAVGDRARAAGVVACHAADRGLRAGRDIDGEPEPLGPQRRVELIEHHAGLDGRALAIDLQDTMQVLGVVDHEGRTDCLAALRAARAARQQRHACIRRYRNRGTRRFLRARHDDAERLDLVDRSVGCIAAATRAVEQDLGVELLAQPRRERGTICSRELDRNQGSVHRRRS